jgi:DeoR/GlpR family transcriptional regulator of sugar metabolism
LLEQEGFLKRVHGGAVLENADDIAKRLVVNYEKKQRIARAAAAFVTKGESILIESGSINAILVKELGKREGVTIIASNLFIARQLRVAVIIA